MYFNDVAPNGTDLCLGDTVLLARLAIGIPRVRQLLQEQREQEGLVRHRRAQVYNGPRGPFTPT